MTADRRFDSDGPAGGGDDDALIAALAHYDESRESAAVADFPAVVDALDSEPGPDVPAHVQTGFDAWKREDPTRRDAAKLIAAIRKAKLARRQEEDEKDPEGPRLYEYQLECERYFAERWHRAKRYWLTVLFEFVFLAGLIVFALLPWLRNGGRLAWSIHLGLLPVLLLLPHYLGYAPLTFTSAFPNVGGVFYPWLIIHLRRLPCTGLNAALIERLPKILEPLCQLPGPMMAHSGMGMPGLVSLAVLGAGIGGATFTLGTLWRRWKGRRSRPEQAG